jgi:hypothetical protein
LSIAAQQVKKRKNDTACTVNIFAVVARTWHGAKKALYFDGKLKLQTIIACDAPPERCWCGQ